jgi:hypothetical protein
MLVERVTSTPMASMGSPNEIVAGCEKLRVYISIISQELPLRRKSSARCRPV